MGIDGVDVDIDNVDNVEDKSRTSEYCICCICEKPEVLVLPEYLKACDSNFVEDVSSVITSCVVTILNERMVSGCFPKELDIDCHSAKVASSSNKVTRDLKER